MADAVRRSPVTALLGPRQCGKTTLAREFGVSRRAVHFDLESAAARHRLQNPEMALGFLTGLIVLDGIVQCPPGAGGSSSHGGAELDLMFTHRGQRYGVEFKFSETPDATHSMRVSISDLGLKHLWIVYPGVDRFPIDRHLSAWPLKDIVKLPKELSPRG